MTLALLDVDHVKIINDKQGHFLGDTVLKENANLLLGSVEEGMLASRFGSEEFTLLIPIFDIDEGAPLVQNILDKRESRIMILDSLTVTVTASVRLTTV